MLAFSLRMAPTGGQNTLCAVAYVLDAPKGYKIKGPAFKRAATCSLPSTRCAQKFKCPGQNVPLSQELTQQRCCCLASCDDRKATRHY